MTTKIQDAGDTIATTWTVAAVQRMVTFTELSLMDMVTTTENDVEIMPGVRGTRIATRPIFTSRKSG